LLVVSDQTRKTAADRVLPVLLREWQRHGLDLERFSLVVACGTHRTPTHPELLQIIGPEAFRLLTPRITAHDAFNTPCTRVGTTSRGTPVELNRNAVEVDAVITIGAVLFHYFAGFTGGRKSIVPGLASAATIARNHSLTIDLEHQRPDPAVGLGRLTGNPVAEDLDEAAEFLSARATVQTVVDAAGNTAGVFAGNLRDAHQSACRLAADIFGFPLRQPVDIVIGTAGPARNWLQSHKALVNATEARTNNGIVLLHAPCTEGLGSASLARWLGTRKQRDIIRGIAETADINAQTALSTLTRGSRAILLNVEDPDVVAVTGIPCAEDLKDALTQARDRLPDNGRGTPTILPMPEAWLTVPLRTANTGAVISSRSMSVD